VLDSDALGRLLAEHRPSVVFHLAAQMDVRRSLVDIPFDARANVLGTLNVLLAASAAGVPRLVNTSTGGAIYGPRVDVPTAEDAVAEPLSPYGVSKLCAEQYVDWFGRSGRLSTLTLRYGNVYGPRQDPRGEAGVVAIFGQAILDGQPLTVFGDGRQTRDFVFVDDVVRANLLAADAANAGVGGVVNVGTGVATSVLDIVDALEAARAGGRAGIDVTHAPPREGEVQDSCLAVGRAAARLGFRAAVPLDVGIARTWAWLVGAAESAGSLPET
jgi:UDP-glucose 4-epimerase